jgi:hypothetical protein
VPIDPDGGFVSFPGIEDAAFEHALQVGIGFISGERFLDGPIRFVKAFSAEQHFDEQDAGGNGGGSLASCRCRSSMAASV